MNFELCWRWLLIACLIFVFAPDHINAQEVILDGPPRRLAEEAWVDPVAGSLVQTNLGLRTWISWGQSELSYAGVNGVPDVMSDLHWRRLQNTMLEFSADSLWFDRLIVRTDLGVGTNGTGRLQDQDFAGSGRTGLTSESQHPVDADNLYYFNLDLGWRLVTWHGFRRSDSCLAIDALIGWQYWSEKYVARDGIDVFPGTRVFPPGDAIASRLTWDSLRLGLRGQWQISECWLIDSRIFFIPYTEFENRDIHYLRPDLLQDPSFFDRADGGLGIMADVTLTWRIRPNLGLELGYRVWDIRSDDGISITRTPAGDFGSPLNHASTLRHGALIGLHWRF